MINFLKKKNKLHDFEFDIYFDKGYRKIQIVLTGKDDKGNEYIADIKFNKLKDNEKYRPLLSLPLQDMCIIDKLNNTIDVFYRQLEDK